MGKSSWPTTRKKGAKAPHKYNLFSNIVKTIVFACGNGCGMVRGSFCTKSQLRALRKCFLFLIVLNCSLKKVDRQTTTDLGCFEAPGVLKTASAFIFHHIWYGWTTGTSRKISMISWKISMVSGKNIYDFCKKYRWFLQKYRWFLQTYRWFLETYRWFLEKYRWFLEATGSHAISGLGRSIPFK